MDEYECNLCTEKIIDNEKSQNEYLTINGKIPKNIKILRFERYNQEIKKFCISNKIKFKNIHTNKSFKNKYKNIDIEYLLKVLKKSHHWKDYKKLKIKNSLKLTYII